MQRLGRSKLFVIEYSFETQRPMFILADNMEDALGNHKKIFPGYHRNLESSRFLSAAPLFTEKIAGQEFRNAKGRKEQGGLVVLSAPDEEE